MQTVALIDYGSGNLRSAEKALREAARRQGIAADIVVTADPTIVANAAFGVNPTGMKKAVIMPHAMIAAILGMIIPDRNVPNF